jgi:hypothetical protein
MGNLEQHLPKKLSLDNLMIEKLGYKVSIILN